MADVCENCDVEVNDCSCDNVSFSSVGSEHLSSQVHADNVFVQNMSSLSAQNNIFCDSNVQESSPFMHNVSDNMLSASNATVLSSFKDDSSVLNASLNSNHACHTLNLGLTGKGMRIGHLNIQGLSNKIDQVKLMLTSRNNSVHILGLSEIKLEDYHPDSVFLIDGYQKPMRKDRLEGGGGIIVYIKEGVVFKRRSDLELKELECVWLEICPTNSNSFLICFMYRHPNARVGWNESFENCLDKIYGVEKELYILGDFNRDLFNTNIKRNWLDFFPRLVCIKW